MSIRSLCSIHNIDVLEYVNVPGASMGKSTQWQVRRRLPCRVRPISTDTSPAGQVKIQNQEITHKITFPDDPELVQGNKLRWMGVILTVLGLPLNSHGVNRRWDITAVAYATDNLNPNVEMV